jgi:hypothetical protein
MVRNCIAKLEREHGRQNLAFATYTLPDLPAQDMEHIAQEIGVIANRLKQEIEREQVRFGINPAVVYVIEIQGKRYRETGVIAPHIHVVFQSRKTRYHRYAITRERNTEIWNRMISNALGRRVEIPSGANIQQVKKSAENYMSKYMSKGGKIAQELDNDGQRNCLPKSWWGASLSLRRWVKANIKLLADTAQQFIKDNYKQFLGNISQSPFSWLYVHTVTLTESHGEEIEIPVAVIGKVKPNWIDSFDTCSLNEWNWLENSK